MSRIATTIAGCRCNCRRVAFRSAVQTSGGYFLPGAEGTLSYTPDSDCDSLSGVMAVTPFDRRLPVREDCLPVGAFTVTVDSPPSGGYSHIGWVVEENGTRTEHLLPTFAGPLTADSLEWTPEGPGELVTITAVFRTLTGGAGATVPVSCSPNLLFPSHIELTLPSTIDLSGFDADNSGGAFPLGCRIFGEGLYYGWVSNTAPIVRSADDFDRQGPTTVILECTETRADRWCAFATYYYKSPSGVCAEVSIQASFGAIPGSLLAPYGCSVFSGAAWARCAVKVYFVDEAVVTAPGATPVPIVSYAWFNAFKMLGVSVDEGTLRTHVLAQPESSSGDYGYTSPVTIWDGVSILDNYGADEDWCHFDTFYATHPHGTAAPCDNDVSSWPPFGGYQPTGATNISFPFAVDTTTPALNAATDCQCVVGLTDASGNPIELRTSALYLGDGQSLTTEMCECTKTIGSDVIECFPKRIEITLPDGLDLSAFTGDCSPGGISALSASLDDTYIDDGNLTLDSTVPNKIVFDANCTTITALDPPSGTATYPIQKLTRGSTIEWFAYQCDYLPNITGSDPYECELQAYCGYVTQNDELLEPTTLVRFYTMLRLRVQVANGAFTAPLDFWAVNPGPEVDIAGMSDGDIREFALVQNWLNWSHNWEFFPGNWGMDILVTGHYGPPPCAATSAGTPPQSGYCPHSLPPNWWAVSQARKDVGGGATLLSMCPDCFSSGTGAPEENWAHICASQHGGEVAFQFAARPTYAPVTTIDVDTVNLLRYHT